MSSDHESEDNALSGRWSGSSGSLTGDIESIISDLSDREERKRSRKRSVSDTSSSQPTKRPRGGHSGDSVHAGDLGHDPSAASGKGRAENSGGCVGYNFTWWSDINCNTEVSEPYSSLPSDGSLSTSVETRPTTSVRAINLTADFTSRDRSGFIRSVLFRLLLLIFIALCSWVATYLSQVIPVSQRTNSTTA